MTQPVFDPNRVSGYFTLCCHKCTHFWITNFAWISCTAVHLYIILLLLVHTLLGQFAVQLDTTKHCAWISCTAVYLYFSPESVPSESLYTAALYNCTLVSASLASVLSTNHRRTLIYLLHFDWSPRRRLDEEEL